MSQPSKPLSEEKKEGEPQNKKEEKKKDNKEEEEDEGYSCSACWNGYCACVVWTCKVN
jgi:hypothetical protein